MTYKERSPVFCEEIISIDHFRSSCLSFFTFYIICSDIVFLSSFPQVFDEVGRIATDKELEEMLADAPHPINFTMLLQMFAERDTGSSDDDDVVIAAFNAFSQDGWIDGDM